MAPEESGSLQQVYVFDEFTDLVPARWIEQVVALTLALEPDRLPTLAEGPAVDVVIADDETVKSLNSRFRGLDETTDVLAFSFSHEGAYYGTDGPPPERPETFGFVTPPEVKAGLGEVIVSYPRAVIQARESGNTPQRELTLLLAHGVLHLLGYDHVEPEEAAAMKAKESTVAAQVLDYE